MPLRCRLFRELPRHCRSVFNRRLLNTFASDHSGATLLTECRTIVYIVSTLVTKHNQSSVSV
jgi:hypothetical protein